MRAVLTCVLVVVSVLHSTEYPREGGLPDAVLSQKYDLVDLSVGVATGRDDRVGGVGHAAVAVLLAGTVGRAAREAGQLARQHRGYGGTQLAVIHRHAPPVQGLKVHGKRRAPSPSVHVPQLVAFVQSHGCDEHKRSLNTSLDKVASDLKDAECGIRNEAL